MLLINIILVGVKSNNDYQYVPLHAVYDTRA